MSSSNIVLLGEVLQELSLLLPEVDALLVLHVALGVKDVLNGELLHESVSLELLSDLGSNGGDGELHLVQVSKGGGSTQKLSVQRQSSLLELLLGSGELDGLGKCSCNDSHVCASGSRGDSDTGKYAPELTKIFGTNDWMGENLIRWSSKQRIFGGCTAPIAENVWILLVMDIWS